MSNVACSHSRNWLAYLVDALVHSGAMPTWEAVEYVTANLIGEPPNLNLHHTKSPYEAIQQFLLRLYGPIVEAASRSVTLPPQAMIHMFTDISLMGKSAVLVVYFPGNNLPHHLLLLDSAPAWDLMFPHVDQFNRWAQERYTWITEALAGVQRLRDLSCEEPRAHAQMAQPLSFQPVGGA